LISIINAAFLTKLNQLIVTEGGDSCGKSMSLETPQEATFFRGGSSHARGKHPPAVKINVAKYAPNT